MKSEEYFYYKNKYNDILLTLANNKMASEYYNELKNNIKFDDFRHEIKYIGTNKELIKCYFPIKDIKFIR